MAWFEVVFRNLPCISVEKQVKLFIIERVYISKIHAHVSVLRKWDNNIEIAVKEVRNVAASCCIRIGIWIPYEFL